MTEFGVADMRGRTLAPRATASITVAHPRFRDEIVAPARTLGYV